ncbi:MAG: SDR family oxidoreductase [Betaproteobacteria bacterium]|nr:SDR family oxidoreductase [Betaproteobacteria bacterium]
MDLELSGKQAVVTGGSRGIGFGIAERLIKEGCSVTIVGRDRVAVDKALASLRATANGRVAVVGHCADLVDVKQIESVFPLLTDADILVNSAGAVPRGSLADTPAAKLRPAFDAKVMGTIDLCREVMRHMTARRSGVIINIIGASGERPNPRSIGTSIANAALIAFTQAVGALSVDDNIRMVGINPGLIATERTASVRDASNPVDAAAYQHLRKTLPYGRMGTIEEVADMALFFASPRASYVSGAVVTIDAGTRFRV